MVKGLRNQLTWVAAAAAAVIMGACTVKDQTVPPLSGPSVAALSVTATATPDSILQDGASQSSIAVVVRDANAKPISGQVLRLDMSVGGQIQDYGTLAARTIVTGTDGRATTVYTAPAAPPANAGSSGNLVSIVVTPSGTDFNTAAPQTVAIRLVPPGVILPPAGTPTASFNYSPTPVSVGSAVTFDASASCAGALSGGSCSSGGSIASYSWSFGDGGTGSGKSVSHTFNAAQTFSVTLTVTNDRGVAASSTQPVSVTAVTGPKADFVFSPSAPSTGQAVVFNADISSAAAGHTITTYSWNFGDGATGNGYTTSHTYNAAGAYNVVLSILDDTGQKATTSKAVTVTGGGGTGGLTAAFTVSPTDPVSGTAVSFNANTSTPLSTITAFDWDFGDGTVINNQTSPSITHTYYTSLDATFTIRLTVHNASGQIATTTQTLKVSSGIGPSALFTTSPSPAAVGATVTFTSTSTGFAPLTYQWTFGDGTPTIAGGATVTHAYAAAGTYTIRLVVTDANGRSSQTTHDLVVQ